MLNEFNTADTRNITRSITVITAAITTAEKLASNLCFYLHKLFLISRPPLPCLSQTHLLIPEHLESQHPLEDKAMDQHLPHQHPAEYRYQPHNDLLGDERRCAQEAVAREGDGKREEKSDGEEEERERGGCGKGRGEERKRTMKRKKRGRGCS